MQESIISDAPSEQFNFPANFGLPNFWTRRKVGNMNPRVSNHKTAAMTLTEVLVVIFVVAVLVAVLLPALAPHHDGRLPISCVNNLKQVVFGYRIWAGDNNDRYPMQVSIANGGTMGLNNGQNAWINFLVMSNELATPKILVCPQDKEHQPPATNFSSQLVGHVSYFVGMDADQDHPQMFLSGDDNFAIGGVPVKSGLLEFSTNAPIAWTAERHVNAGNIGLADGSVASVTDSGLINLLHQTGVATNRLAIP